MYTTRDINCSVTISPVKVIAAIGDISNDIGNDKPAAAVELLLESKPVIHKVDAKKGLMIQNSEGNIEKCSRQWLHISGIKLTSNDRDAIMNGHRLNDLVINFAQKVLKIQFPSLKGFQSTPVQEKNSKFTFEQDKVQIIHSCENHWIVATSHRGYII